MCRLEEEEVRDDWKSLTGRPKERLSCGVKCAKELKVKAVLKD